MRLMSFSRADFPDNFLLGAAAAAYLIEGDAFSIMVCFGLGILLFSHALDRCARIGPSTNWQGYWLCKFDDAFFASECRKFKPFFLRC